MTPGSKDRGVVFRSTIDRMGTVDVLTEYETEHIRERQALPARYLGL